MFSGADGGGLLGCCGVVVCVGVGTGVSARDGGSGMLSASAGELPPVGVGVAVLGAEGGLLRETGGVTSCLSGGGVRSSG